jgi:hypothetical protein
LALSSFRNNNYFGDNMKRSVTFSLEEDNVSKLSDTCNNKGLNRNAVIDALINEWVQTEAIETISIISCDVCGSKYSERLKVCPSCEDKKIKDIEALSRKRDDSFRTAEMEKLNIDLIEMHHRKEYLMKHLLLGHAQQSEIDVVDEQIKRTTDRIEEMKRV